MQAFTPAKIVALTGSNNSLAAVCVPCAISSAKYLMAPGKGVAAASPSAQKERPAICSDTSLMCVMSASASDFRSRGDGAGRPTSRCLHGKGCTCRTTRACRTPANGSRHE